MSNGALTGAVGGAAQGAAAGFMVGNVYGAVIGGIIGGVAGLFSGSANDSALANQTAWMRYNALGQYQANAYNLQMQTQLSLFNAFAGVAAARSNANAVKQVAEYNAALVAAARDYNTALTYIEEEKLWESMHLDIRRIEDARARERGIMVADQGASGTVIGEGSNAEVVIDQMTQEAMDVLVVERGAQHGAADIANARAQGEWEANLQISQMLWEAQVQQQNIMRNAKIQGMSGIMGAMLNYQAGTYSNQQQLASANAGIQQNWVQTQNSNTQAMVGQMFQAAGTYASAVYAKKPLNTGNQTQIPSQSRAHSGMTPATVYMPSASLATSGGRSSTTGTSLLSGSRGYWN